MNNTTLCEKRKPFQRLCLLAMMTALCLAGTPKAEAALGSALRGQPRKALKPSTHIGQPTPSPFAPRPPALMPPAPAASAPTSGELVVIAPPKPKFRYAYRPTVPPSPEKIEAERQKTIANTIAWEKLRAEAGSERAQYALGLRYVKGDGVPQNVPLGSSYLRKAADNGYAPAEREWQRIVDLHIGTRRKPAAVDTQHLKPGKPRAD
ncbi:MAG: tetratricopeptide repeat protein [Verrucomicrobiales bacterium]